MSIKRVGLTGGIGSGKSSVAAIFAKLGAPVLDLDMVGRSVVGPGSAGLNALRDKFGEFILDSDGSLNRAALAQHCFADAGETNKLNRILHPLIRQAEDQWLALQQGSYAIIEASVLLESGGADRMDVVLVILADTDLRRKRVLLRGDRNCHQFDAIVDRQCSDEQRKSSADVILENSSDLEALKQQVDLIHKQLLRRFKD